MKPWLSLEPDKCLIDILRKVCIRKRHSPPQEKWLRVFSDIDSCLSFSTEAKMTRKKTQMTCQMLQWKACKNLFMFIFFKDLQGKCKTPNSILNLREFALIKQQHCYTIIYVHMAQWPSRLMSLCCERRIALIIQICLRQSNYFAAVCELKSVPSLMEWDLRFHCQSRLMATQCAAPGRYSRPVVVGRKLFESAGEWGHLWGRCVLYVWVSFRHLLSC